MKAFYTTSILGIKKNQPYISPNVDEAAIDYDFLLCFSGEHEGFNENEW